ncbi:MAG: hypothetical protein ABR884_04325 [Minisyncoccia bacterium]
MNTTRVHVSGWDHSRTVIFGDDGVQFEVGMDHNHCPTCAARVRHVERALFRKGMSADWRGGRGSALYVVLPRLPEGRELKQYVGDALDLCLA